MMNNAVAAYDEVYMRQAIELAKKGIYTTSPNPRVGCVIVNENNVVGQGFHQFAGQAHAEIHALNQAGERARNATAYVTLEPCAHFGKTPPCADALIASGVSRVVIGSVDPNPSVSGKGIERLQAAGIETTVGVLQADCDALNVGFFKRMRTGHPYVRIKMAMSLDGRIATQTGDSQWITSTLARQQVQHYRAAACAILTSSRTVTMDNPQLTVRLPDTLRQPKRVIVDTHLTINPDSRILHEAGEVVIFYVKASPEAIAALSPLATLNQVPSQQSAVMGTNYADLTSVMSHLANLGCNDVLVEAGGVFAGALLASGLVDELILHYGPKLIGHQGRAAFALPDIQKLSDAYCFVTQHCRQLGDDIELVLRKQ